jgi:hypothetical protein
MDLAGGRTMATLILNSLGVRNFRAFHDLKIERLGRVNLIVGKNNVGKTSLLEALQLYARKAPTPAYIWDIMKNRRETRQSFKEVKDMLATLRYLFYGRKDVLPGLEPIEIGPMNSSKETLSIGIIWTVIEYLPDRSARVRPLGQEENYVSDDLLPYLSIEMGDSGTSYSLEPTSSQPVVRLNTNEIPCITTSASGLSGQRLTELWDGIALTDLEDDVLSALKLIAPGVKDLNFVSTPLSGSERIPVVRIADINEPLPLYSLGDGMLRTLGISLALVNAKDGLLLIDEFENGLYYTVQPELWRFIFQVARRLNVQVFATTHSWDCIEGFQKAARTAQEEEGLLIRLESKKGEITATLYDKQELGIATREQIEVR